MNSNNCIEQKGIIEEIEKGIATVSITSFSACASCQSKSACGMSEEADKQIHVKIPDGYYRKGELVKILMKKSLGLRATLLAYVLPFIIVIFSLIVLSSLKISESLAGIVSIATLVIYFYILYLNKNKLNKTFQFTLNKVN